jgi:hypothetical protein
LRRADGEYIWVIARGLVISDEKGHAKRIAGSISSIEERKQTETELRKTQKRLVDAAHRAGMADVASEVLHNVGNILNSINVSTTQMTEIVSGSRLATLEKVTAMLGEHRDALATFLTQDAKGKHIPVFLAEASRLMKEEEDRMVQMLEGLAKNVRHIKDTISMQQSYAKVSGVEECTTLTEVIEDAIRIVTPYAVDVNSGVEEHPGKKSHVLMKDLMAKVNSGSN